MLRSGEYTSTEVTVAFCKRAAVAQQLTGCCTEMFFDEAIARAQELDEYMDRTGKPLGPLHGLPISLKDLHNVKGKDTTVGWVGLVGKPALEDDVGVTYLRKLGAILYVKTNIPQSMMMSDSYNHVFGQSVNSLNSKLISGGSSGGEAALVAVNGSILGIGSDIGGSIRIPANVQGLYGLSPTTGRVSNRSSIDYQRYIVPPVAGPIASSLSSIEFFMSSYMSGNPYLLDPSLLHIPWSTERAKIPERPLKIGVICNDGVVRPQPPIERAVREVANELKSRGHTVVDWDTTDHASAYFDLWLPAVLADGGQRCADNCALIGEPLIQGMIVGTPETLLTIPQRLKLAERIYKYQCSYLRRWKESEVDAVISPVQPWVGFPPRAWVKSQQYCGYTAHLNLLNWASLAIPWTNVDVTLDVPSEEWTMYEGHSFSDKFNHDQYDVDLVRGMPVGVQVIGGRFGEEKAVAVAKLVDQIRHGRRDSEGMK